MTLHKHNGGCTRNYCYNPPPNYRITPPPPPNARILPVNRNKEQIHAVSNGMLLRTSLMVGVYDSIRRALVGEGNVLTWQELLDFDSQAMAHAFLQAPQVEVTA